MSLPLRLAPYPTSPCASPAGRREDERRHVRRKTSRESGQVSRGFARLCLFLLPAPGVPPLPLSADRVLPSRSESPGCRRGVSSPLSCCCSCRRRRRPRAHLPPSRRPVPTPDKVAPRVGVRPRRPRPGPVGECVGPRRPRSSRAARGAGVQWGPPARLGTPRASGRFGGRWFGGIGRSRAAGRRAPGETQCVNLQTVEERLAAILVALFSATVSFS